ncbi:DUF4956 domain-containing protein [bacterium]|nr:DUF4956 domain-containing protein [bacterium]
MEFLEVPLFDDDIIKLGVRFVFNLLFLVIVVRFAIFPNLRKREFVFTAVMMNIMVFFICFTLKKLEIQLGMAIGLFAIFGVLRYRTDAIRAKEMTYLFIVIGIAVINALSNKKTSYSELIAVNCVILIGSIVMEQLSKNAPKQRKQNLQYDSLELLGPDHREELLADLKKRTGIDASRVEIRGVDLTEQKASLTIWYDDPTKS